MPNQYAPGMSSIYQTESMFGGSLVATPSRPQGMLYALKLGLMPEDVVDSQVQIVFKAAMMSVEDKWSCAPTPQNLAVIILNEKLVPEVTDQSPEAVSARLAEIASQITAMSESGVDSVNSFNNLAATIRDHVATLKLYQYGDKAKKMAADQTATANDLYDQLSQELEASRPNAVEPRIYTTKDQKRIMAEMRVRQKALIGKHLMTLPTQWWLHDYIEYLLPGLMYIITGLTGRGKSSILQQIADFLAECGFKVIYFHAEDGIEIQMMRLAARLEAASMKEMMAGDPKGKFKEVGNRLDERLKISGGEVVYVHCVNEPVSFIRQVTMLLKPDVIIVDYLQKINRTPLLGVSGQKDDLALAAVTEQLKQLAEHQDHQVVVIAGSQDVEHDQTGARKGTFGSRQIEQKGQAVIEIERPRLRDDEDPEMSEGIQIAGPGDLSGFAYVTIHKNNNGPTGSVTGVFNGLSYSFKSLSFLKWQRENPGRDYPVPTLQEPSEDFYEGFRKKFKAWENMDVTLKDPRTRRKEEKEAKGKAAAANKESNKPFGAKNNGDDDDGNVPF